MAEDPTPAPDPKKEKPQAKEGQFHARLDTPAFAVLKRISEQESLSLNDAMNLILRQYGTYPRDWIEMNAKSSTPISRSNLCRNSWRPASATRSPSSGCWKTELSTSSYKNSDFEKTPPS
jgi:hypothetical protein